MERTPDTSAPTGRDIGRPIGVLDRTPSRRTGIRKILVCDALGVRYRGLLLSADAGRNVVFGYQPTAKGAGFALERNDFLSSLAAPNVNYIWNQVDQDRRKWFRPSDVAVGADGAIYVADWYDPIVGGHQMHDGKGYGRIYRITPKGRRLTTPALDLNTTAGQIQALLSPAVNVRSIGFEKLKANGPKSVPAVKNVLADANPFHRARAIWLLAQLGPAGVQEVARLLSDSEPQIRIVALRALRRVQGPALDVARRLSQDPSPAVRREVALTLRGVPFDASRDIILKLAERYNDDDRWYLEALGTAATGNEEALYAALLPVIGHTDPLQWSPSFARIAWRLHPAGAIDAFAVRAASSRLSASARSQAIVALGFVRDPRAAQAMARLTGSALPDVSSQAAWWMTYRKSNDWRTYEVDGWIVETSNTRAVAPAVTAANRELVLDGAAPIDRRIDAALAMAREPVGALLLIQLAAEGKIAYQLREAIGSVIFSNPDRIVRASAAAYFQRPGNPSRLAVADVIGRAANPERGRQQFAANCATCHRRGGAGADVGPDLTDVSRKFDLRGLVDAIVNPNAAIAFGFTPELFVTRQDAAQVGFLQADGETVSMRDGYGRVQTFAREALTSRLALKTTLMPDPLALALSEQDVADIAAFLMADRP
jgi:putative heme-binding domain-containing protein